MMTIEDEDIKFNKKIEERRQDWHSLEYKHLGKEELGQLMNASPLPRLAKRSAKENLVFGAKVVVTVILMIAVNFAGSWHLPIAAAWVVLLLIDDYIDFRYVYFLPVKDSVRMTLLTVLVAFRRLRMMYVLAPVAIWTAITWIARLMPNDGRAVITAFAVLPVLPFVCLLTWWIWTRRIKEIQTRLELFEE